MKVVTSCTLIIFNCLLVLQCLWKKNSNKFHGIVNIFCDFFFSFGWVHYASSTSLAVRAAATQPRRIGLVGANCWACTRGRGTRRGSRQPPLHDRLPLARGAGRDGRLLP